MTTIAPNDQNYLRILNFWVKIFLTDDNGLLVSVSILAETKIFFLVSVSVSAKKKNGCFD